MRCVSATIYGYIRVSVHEKELICNDDLPEN